MGRPQSAPYFYSVANQKGSKDRYVLSIMDKSKRSGYKKLVFHASKREAGLKAKELYDDYVEYSHASAPLISTLAPPNLKLSTT